jgi:uncharacterized protein YdaU (DUF1376 family)
LLPDRKGLPLPLPQFLQRVLKKREIMHYYQFSIGDYRAATAHLTNEEDLAYRRLLDMYYDSEQKIPLDTQWVARRLRVDANVVRDVLTDMFVQHEDGWFHARCADVIEQYHAMAEKNRANGRLGGRKKNPVGSDLQPIAKATINQEPITNNHKPKRDSATVVATPEGVSDSVWQDFVKQRKAKKAAVTQTVIDGIQREANKAAWTLDAALAECVVRGWQSFKADWVADKQQQTETVYQRSMRLKMQEAVPSIAKQAPEPYQDAADFFRTIDMESTVQLIGDKK